MTAPASTSVQLARLASGRRLVLFAFIAELIGLPFAFAWSAIAMVSFILIGVSIILGLMAAARISRGYSIVTTVLAFILVVVPVVSLLTFICLYVAASVRLRHGQRSAKGLTADSN
jgi:uncharacterized paraquat-inducible protein A